jgi:ATP-dependent Clp protease protease subunit
MSKNYLSDNDKETKKYSEYKNNLRHIYLFDEICLDISEEFLKKLHHLEEKSNKSITVFINSPGGDSASGFAIIDALLLSKCNIITVAIGEICSMAPAVFIAGKERYITKNTFVMFHPITTYSSDYIEFAKSRLKNAEELEKVYDKYILERTKIPKRLLQSAKNKEVWLNSKEAIEYGIAQDYYKGEIK